MKYNEIFWIRFLIQAMHFLVFLLSIGHFKTYYEMLVLMESPMETFLSRQSIQLLLLTLLVALIGNLVLFLYYFFGKSKKFILRALVFEFLLMLFSVCAFSLALSAASIYCFCLCFILFMKIKKQA
jgi:hypothetical protein